MERASIGGRANWTGAAFELRLGVEFCVYILMGEEAGLGPGAARRVQLQAPEVIDDLILEFETGTRWAIQAKAGPSVRVEWNPDKPFGKALRQLYNGATSGQIDLAPDSLDRVELAVDHRAHANVTGFGEWLAQARQHHEWDHFVAASTGPEQTWAQKLPALLSTEPGDDLLAFLKRLYVRRASPPDAWRSDLRGRLIMAGVPDATTADQILDVLLAQVAEAAPHAGQLDAGDLRRASDQIQGLPRPGAPPFRLFRRPTEDELYRELKMPPDRPSCFVERPELAAALDTGGVLVAGRPGSGKSHALIKLALARPDWPVVVVARHFRADDLSRLTAQSRRIHTPYQLLWDDVHEKPDLFADAVSRLAEQGEGLRVLAAYRDQHEGAVQERVTPDFRRRVGIETEPLRLRPFDAGQAARMAEAVAEALGLALDGAARETFARHIRRGDGGPLFALSTGKLLQGQQEEGRPVRAADVTRLPDDLLETWRYLYQRLADRPNGPCMQDLLGVLHFLYRISCPLNARLAEFLFRRTLQYRREEFETAARALVRQGWLRRDPDAFAAHDVTLEAVPEEPGNFHRFVRSARPEAPGEELALGLLRGSLSSFYSGQIPHTRTARERQMAAAEAMELGDLAIADFRAVGHTRYLGTTLNNASVFYSDLAGLEERREGRVALLQQALAASEEAVRIRRDLGLQADLASSLNNASACYSDLAGLEETRAGRVALLQQALAASEEAAHLYRDLGLQAELASSLNNASDSYSDLAGLEERHAGRAALLQQALAAIEEAARLYRDLGLQAELAMSLNNASVLYSDLAGLEERHAGRVALLQQALAAIEEAVETFRNQGIVPYLMVGLGNAVLRHVELAQHTDELNRARVLALCREGEALCVPMEDQDSLAFFRHVRQQLEEAEGAMHP